MNKFRIVACVKANEGKDAPSTSPDTDYNGYVVVMACAADPGFTLFFPISNEHAKMMTYILAEKKYDINTDILGIYKAMLDSWNSSDRFLSGIIMDVFYDRKAKDDLIMIRLALSDSSGEIDALVKVNFVHAIFLSAMDCVEITISDELLEKLVPKESCQHRPVRREEHNAAPGCHEDKKLLRIVKDIMSGKIKEDDAEPHKTDGKEGQDDEEGKDDKK